MLIVLSLTCPSSAAASVSYRDGRSFLGTDMQPETVAKTLASVEDEWKTQARSYIECEESESSEDAIRDCDSTPGPFSKSCATVINAIIRGSGGDRKVTREYMVDVCQQQNMGGWYRSGCVALAKDVNAKMTASSYDNRVSFPAAQVCDTFWGHFLEEQKPLRVQELAAKHEQDKQAAAAKAEVAKKEQEHAKKAEKDVADALSGDDAKEELELEAERKEVALRENRTIDRSLHLKEAQVEGVVEAADAKIKEATQVEEEGLDTPEPATKAATAKRADVLPPVVKADAPKVTASATPATDSPLITKPAAESTSKVAATKAKK